jgi:hypothetical protein
MFRILFRSSSGKSSTEITLGLISSLIRIRLSIPRWSSSGLTLSSVLMVSAAVSALASFLTSLFSSHDYQAQERIHAERHLFDVG